ncbi:hypothetical protein K431DRAFT_290537 [Polychaeton citri CBS 116435]|uniref:Heterokaryon incompatibility domain-containing protein n=1 Tax=Polychaeton citri CBS 116435 TaxID=1314669 RepID=A0A9P4UUS1_9PEZI|nr:hypothetical protein K431DRAFT_290537 [Polychaeton citri CBS 116435]
MEKGQNNTHEDYSLKTLLSCQQHSTEETYEYAPLWEDQIRLLCIQYPGTDDRLDCHLRTITSIWKFRHPPVARSRFTHYVALSYAWGPTYPGLSHLTDFIYCDGKRLEVTPNLHQALKRIRQTQQPRRGGDFGLWIDAICIDQNNLEERSIKVQMMAEIYR